MKAKTSACYQKSVRSWKCPIPKCEFQTNGMMTTTQLAERKCKHLTRAHGLTGVKLKAITRKERADRRLQLQKSLQSPVLTIRPDLQFSFKLPISPASEVPPAPGSRVWWRCDCGFEIRNSDERTQTTAKWRHLQQEHGILRKEMPASVRSVQHTAPINPYKRIAGSRKAFDIRWQAQWKAFQKLRWPGSHDLPMEATSWRQYKTKG